MNDRGAFDADQHQPLTGPDDSPALRPTCAAVFVHGLFSHARTWDSLINALTKEQTVSSEYALLSYSYASPRVLFNPLKRIPDFNTLADSLATFIDVECAKFERIVLIGHSQGGLIIQRYLAKMLGDRRGRDLLKINRIVLIACPNNGSELALSVRRVLSPLWRHAQERQLRPLTPEILAAQQRVLRDIVFANEIGSDSCPIEFAVYIGESDNVVDRESAMGLFPRVGALPGDHNSVIRADIRGSRTLSALRAHLLLALNQPRGQMSDAEGLSRRTEVSDPLIRIVNTTSSSESVQSIAIDIYDRRTADLWIQQQGISGKLHAPAALENEL